MLIAEACRVSEKSVLARTNRGLNELLTPALYRYNVQREGGSAMFWAAQHGCIETLERLVSYGAEVNDNTASRYRVVHRPYYPYGPGLLHDTFFAPLHIAAKFGQDGAVKWLLNHGARIESMAHNLCACQEGVTDVANDDDFDPRMSPLATPFHIAMCNGKLQTAKLLVSRGAEVDVGVATPLHTAARFNNAGAVSFLLERDLVDVDEPDRHGYAPLHLACMEFGDLSAMETLLGFGANLEMQADDGRTPLAFACERGYFKAALRLLDQGANPEVEWDGQTPIQAAALSMRHFFPHEPPPDPERFEDEREELIRRLVQLGVDVDEVGGLGTTALHIAAGQPSLARTLECFLDAGADVNAPDDLQQTPIHLAFESGNLASITVKIVPLLQQGARLDTLCMRGCSAFERALSIARIRDDWSIINSVCQHATTANFGPSFLSRIVRSSYDRHYWEECRVLVRNGAVLDFCEHDLAEKVQACLEHRNVEQMRFLLDIFPDRVTPRLVLNTALQKYHGINQSDIVMITALLDRPDLDVRDHTVGPKNASPLLVACKNHHNPWVIQRLLENSSEVDVFDGEYDTPLSCATRHRCLQTVRLLLRYGADPFLAPPEEDWRAYVEGNHLEARYTVLDSCAADYQTAFHVAIVSHDAYVRRSPSCPHDPTNPHILEIILENHSLPPLPTNPSSQSYIYFALDHPESLDIILKKGADPNSGGYRDEPLLVTAARTGLSDNTAKVVGMLLCSGANINQKGAKDESFLDVFKRAVAEVTQGSDVHDEFKGSKLDKAAALVRHFRIVIDANTGRERIEARPDYEIKAARQDFERLRRAYWQTEQKRLEGKTKPEAETARA